MDTFKDTLKNRLNLLAGANILSAAAIGMTAQMVAANTAAMSGFIHGFRVGLLLAAQIVVVKLMAKYHWATKNDQKLKTLYISENDERSKLIRDKIGGVGFDFALGVITVATIIAGSLNETVFLTLLATLGFLVVLKFSLKMYFSRKY